MEKTLHMDTDTGSGSGSDYDYDYTLQKQPRRQLAGLRLPDRRTMLQQRAEWKTTQLQLQELEDVKRRYGNAAAEDLAREFKREKDIKAARLEEIQRLERHYERRLTLPSASALVKPTITCHACGALGHTSRSKACFEYGGK